VHLKIFGEKLKIELLMSPLGVKGLIEEEDGKYPGLGLIIKVAYGNFSKKVSN
jgi:hypothetical protein